VALQPVDRSITAQLQAATQLSRRRREIAAPSTAPSPCFADCIYHPDLYGQENKMEFLVGNIAQDARAAIEHARVSCLLHGRIMIRPGLLSRALTAAGPATYGPAQRGA